MVDRLILMMFLLFRTFRKTLHVATNTEETILDILYERVNKKLFFIFFLRTSLKTGPNVYKTEQWDLPPVMLKNNKVESLLCGRSYE